MTETEAPPPQGPTATALHAMRDWLARAIADAGQVVVGPPTGSAGTRLCLWPVALLSDQGARGGHGSQPVRLRARYAVMPEGPIEDAVRLLDLVLVAIAGQDAVRLVIEPASGPIRPPSDTVNLTIQLDLPVQITLPTPPITRVTGELRLDGSPLREIDGRLVGPGDVRLSGMTVTAPTTGAAVVTGSGGEFRLPALPGGRAILLHISGRGLQMQVEVPAETTELVVIHCDIEEV